MNELHRDHLQMLPENRALLAYIYSKLAQGDQDSFELLKESMEILRQNGMTIEDIGLHTDQIVGATSRYLRNAGGNYWEVYQEITGFIDAIPCKMQQVAQF